MLSIIKQSLKNEFNSEGNFPRKGPKPKFSDAEVITLRLFCECMVFDSEYYSFKRLYKQYKSKFPNLI